MRCTVTKGVRDFGSKPLVSGVVAMRVVSVDEEVSLDGASPELVDGAVAVAGVDASSEGGRDAFRRASLSGQVVRPNSIRRFTISASVFGRGFEYGSGFSAAIFWNAV